MILKPYATSLMDRYRLHQMSQKRNCYNNGTACMPKLKHLKLKMNVIMWSLIDERSDIFNGWGVARGWLFELGDRDMSGINLFSIEETQKRKIKDLNRELLHARNLAENLREEAKQTQQQVELLKTQAVADAAEIDRLKVQMNNMEQCYIEMKKERDDLMVKAKTVVDNYKRLQGLRVKEDTSTPQVIIDAERRGANDQHLHR